VRAMPRADFFALRRLLPALGARWALVHDGTLGLPRLEAPEVVVGVGDVPATVRGALDAWPVQSESVTGALLSVAEAAAAASAAREASRVLQPGGVAVFVATWEAAAVPAFDAVAAAAGLRVTRRLAIRRAGDTHGWGWVQRLRARRADGEERVLCAIVARRAGGHDLEMPTAGSILAAMFVPRRIGLRRAR
jgi:hypothetical protein